jgi:sRNA-binding protein
MTEQAEARSKNQEARSKKKVARIKKQGARSKKQEEKSKKARSKPSQRCNRSNPPAHVPREVCRFAVSEAGHRVFIPDSCFLILASDTCLLGKDFACRF